MSPLAWAFRVGAFVEQIMTQCCLPSINEFASFAFLLFVLESSRRLRVGPA